MAKKSKSDRLNALRERAQDEQGLDALDDLMTPEARGRRKREGGLRGQMRGKGQQRSPKEGGKDERIRRIYTYLTEPSPGRRVPEVDVSEERLNEFVKYLRRKGEEEEGTIAARAQRMLAFLSEETGGAVVCGIDVKRLKMLLNGARRRLGMEPVRRQSFDFPAGGVDGQPLTVESSLEQLVSLTDGEGQRKKDGGQSVGESDRAPATVRESSKEKPDGAKEADSDWYEDFLR